VDEYCTAFELDEKSMKCGLGSRENVLTTISTHTTTIYFHPDEVPITTTSTTSTATTTTPGLESAVALR
jgi:hypothetical protein